MLTLALSRVAIKIIVSFNIDRIWPISRLFFSRLRCLRCIFPVLIRGPRGTSWSLPGLLLGGGHGGLHGRTAQWPTITAVNPFTHTKQESGVSEAQQRRRCLSLGSLHSFSYLLPPYPVRPAPSLAPKYCAHGSIPSERTQNYKHRTLPRSILDWENRRSCIFEHIRTRGILARSSLDHNARP